MDHCSFDTDTVGRAKRAEHLLWPQIIPGAFDEHGPTVVAVLREVRNTVIDAANDPKKAESMPLIGMAKVLDATLELITD
jgi:hypothetical protein